MLTEILKENLKTLKKNGKNLNENWTKTIQITNTV